MFHYLSQCTCGKDFTLWMGKQQLNGNYGINALKPPFVFCISLKRIFCWLILRSVLGLHTVYVSLYTICGSRGSCPDQRSTLTPFGRRRWAKSTQNVPRYLPLWSSLCLIPHEPPEPSVCGRIVFLAPARWYSFSKCSFQMFPSCPVQPQVYRLGLGPAGSFKKRTSVTWKAKLTDYLTPLKLGVLFCKDGICLVGHSHVAQLEALRAQQTEEK